MNDVSSSERSLQTLRLKAETLAQRNKTKLLSGLEPPSPEKTRQLLHELRVHQIELEMQNDELRRIQLELEAARTRYFNLYDLAPVGYCTLDEQGQIVEANLTAATLLGVARDVLVTQPLSNFIFKDDQDVYYLLRKQLAKTDDLHTCELRMQKKDGMHFWSCLTFRAAPDANNTRLLHVVLSRISEYMSQQTISAPVQNQPFGKFAHDFSNILSSIQGYTEMALEGVTQAKDEELAGYLRDIKQACANAHELIVEFPDLKQTEKRKKTM